MWFGEALLGETSSDDELRRTIELAVLNTNHYDENIAHMFGRRTAREAASAEQQPPETRSVVVDDGNYGLILPS